MKQLVVVAYQACEFSVGHRIEESYQLNFSVCSRFLVGLLQTSLETVVSRSSFSQVLM